MPRHTIHRGHIIDVDAQRVFPGEVDVRDGVISAVRALDHVPDEAGFICPGFIDAHVHIESSMLPPAEFARIAVAHGTVATVSDPHEIANVLGIDGVRAMQEMASQTPCKIHLGIPSCVPATRFETAGATLDASDIEELCKDPSLIYLAEMMNFPGVVHRDPEVMAKLAIAKRHNKKIDGHAPGLRGDALHAYVAAGISTDHECTGIEEAREKQSLGQKILIREGSAAKNFDALWPLLLEKPGSCMFCSDDKHPDDLIEGHINLLCARAIAKGVPLFHVLQAACLNPVGHYGLRSGLLRPGDPADFIRLANLESFQVLETWIDGECVSKAGTSLLPVTRAPIVNHFHCDPKSPADFRAHAPGPAAIVRVIEAIDGTILTGSGEMPATIENGLAMANPEIDLLKITVVNRYQNTPPAVAFLRGIGLRHGAIASSVAHDCHNIVAVGCDDHALADAVNLVIHAGGGISAVGREIHDLLALPIAGLMSDEPAESVAAGYARLTRCAHQLGSTLSAPYMTLSFLSLLVIPSLKLGDRGLFDGGKFEFTRLFT
ncbi:MAG: adenine deaminase [Luteolibacter sp.]